MENKDYLKRRFMHTGIIVLLAVITWTLTLLGKDNPEKVEKIYASILYPFITKTMGRVTGLVPFALGEVLILTLIMIFIGSVIFTLIKPNIILKNIRIILHIIIRVLGVAYILFYFIWGFNYYREDYMTLTDTSIESATLEDLENLTLETIARVNEIRPTLMEDEEGVFLLEKDFKTLEKMAGEGFKDYHVGDMDLGGYYGTAKPLMISKWMSYTGITGIYFPYTAEANVNVDIPDTSIPITMCHEMGHQRGFAREDEANFIGYKASINNPNAEFQYSGYYLALQYLLSDLRKQDIELYEQVKSQISAPVRRDMNYEYDYWKLREGKVEEMATTMNDNYLKANSQDAGVESYNGIVRLLLADYKSRQQD